MCVYLDVTCFVCVANGYSNLLIGKCIKYQNTTMSNLSFVTLYLYMNMNFSFLSTKFMVI